MKAKTIFLRCIGYLSFTKDRIKLDLLQVLGLSLSKSLTTYMYILLLSNLMSYDTVRRCINLQIILVLVIKRSGKVLSKLKCRGLHASSLST